MLKRLWGRGETCSGSQSKERNHDINVRYVDTNIKQSVSINTKSNEKDLHNISCPIDIVENIDSLSGKTITPVSQDFYWEDLDRSRDSNENIGVDMDLNPPCNIPLMNTKLLDNGEKTAYVKGIISPHLSENSCPNVDKHVSTRGDSTDVKSNMLRTITIGGYKDKRSDPNSSQEDITIFEQQDKSKI